MSNDGRITLMTLGDMPLVSSGVGIQTKYVMEGLLKTGKYKIVSLGSALAHPAGTDINRPIGVEPWKEDWLIWPVTGGFVDKMRMRMIMDMFKPDMTWLISDPRFFGALFDSIIAEILPRMPVAWWHIWDNFPPPKFNHDFYRSTTFFGCISKLTHTCIKELGFGDRSAYIPHAVPPDIFKPLPDAEVQAYKEQILGKQNKDKFVIFWNNRNARRKNPSDVIYCAKEFSKIHDDILLVMHCSPFDQEGPNLIEVMKEFGAEKIVFFSQEKLPTDKMNILYNLADVTTNIATSEGFGLSSLESRNAGTCVINNKTGGLQDQVDQGTMAEEDRWGLLLDPVSKSFVGSQQISYILEDRVSHQQVIDALEYFYKLTREERRRRGLIAREWTLKNQNFDKMISDWDYWIQKVIKEYDQNLPPWNHWKNWRVTRDL
jgi:glycosyltransferase involved in cell wall biosynthesis